MGLELINPYVAKIFLALESGDSINRISQKIGSSYSYTYEWIQQLEEIDAIKREDGVRIEDEELAEEFHSVAHSVVTRDIDLEDAYLMPNFSGMDYRFSKTDAVFIWTKGGYQIGRNQRDYPIFIDIHADDQDEWMEFFDEFGLEYSVEDRIQDGEPGIYYVLTPRESDFQTEWIENVWVMPLDETVEWAKKYEVNFQPALEMLDESYDLGLDVEYRERSGMP